MKVMPMHPIAKQHNRVRAQQRAIASVLHEVSSQDDLGSSIQNALLQIKKAVGADIAYVALLPKDSTQIAATAAVGINTDQVPKLEIGGESLTGWVYNNKRSYTWPNGTASDKWYKPYINLANSIRSEVVLPLLYSGEVIGLLVVSSARSNAFDASASRFLENLANEVAILLQNKRFYEAAVRLGQVFFDSSDQKEICDTLARAACSIMDTPISCVWIKEKRGTSNFLVLKGWFGTTIESPEDLAMPRAEGGISWSVLGELERVIEELDVEPESSNAVHRVEIDINTPSSMFRHKQFARSNELASMLSMPIFTHDEVIGVVNTYSKRRYNFFDKEILLFKNLAMRAAVEIKNASLRLEASRINERILDMAQLANPGQVALSFSHDAKHCMHMINSLISSLIFSLPEKRKDEEPCKSVIRSLEVQTGYLKKLFDSLVNFARARTFEKVPTALEDILTEVEYFFQIKLRTSKIRLSISFEPEVEGAEIDCEPEQIEQVFVNLLNNSVDAIRASSRKDGKIDISVRPMGIKKVEILVRDNGIGIAPEHLSEIFMPHFTTKGKQGSGFGLAICKRIIEDNHDGSITVTSVQHEYTTFFIALWRV